MTDFLVIILLFAGMPYQKNQNVLFSRQTKFEIWFIVEKKMARPVLGYSPSNMKKMSFANGGNELEAVRQNLDA